MELEKICNKHGLTLYASDNKNCFRCKKCRIEAVDKRRKKLKQLAVEYKGTKCEKCGYDKCIQALEFHHYDGDKEFGIGSKGITSWEKIKKELQKCMLLCANCHREIHYPNKQN